MRKRQKEFPISIKHILSNFQISHDDDRVIHLNLSLRKAISLSRYNGMAFKFLKSYLISIFLTVF
ncbi:hypothetical protein GCM10008088_11010 [Mesonia mobilis]|uniref:Uncharacterized protein n=1 Tax=Mesonia mobilis TaxID=369791 RepID=A0ABQ3BQN8_9FLAO|nr:hypothetical protein GCM10008088_11010 [Mesonia mobilis]